LNCSNAVKSKHAEDFGFRAIIITEGDHAFRELEKGKGVIYNSETLKPEERADLMKRTIPEFVTDETSYDVLEISLNKGDIVNLKIDLDIRQPNNIVDVELWYSSLIDVPS